jgi:DNA polymerase elongation subunit (family B)
MTVKHFYVYQWVIKEDHIKCYVINKKNKSSCIKIYGFEPILIVEAEINERNLEGEELEQVYKYIEYVLKLDKHEPIRYEIRKMKSSNNLTYISEYILMWFESWEARKHCINFIKKASRIIKNINQNVPVNLIVHSDDIEKLTIFLTEMGLMYTGWVEINVERELEERIETEIKEYRCNDIKTIKKINREYLPEPLILSFDIECYSSNHDTMPQSYKREDIIVMISIVVKRYKKEGIEKYLLLADYYVPVNYLENNNYKDYKLIICKGDIGIVKEFGILIKLIKPDIIVGYNIFGFDFPYMIDKMELYLMDYPDISRLIKEKGTYCKGVEWESSAYGYNIMKKLYAEGRIIIDILYIFRRKKDLESAKLSEVSKIFLGDTKIDLGHNTMFKLLNNITINGINKIIEYCIKDSKLVIELLEKFEMWTSWVEEASITEISIDDLYTRGNQIRVTNQMYNECMKRNIVLKKSDVKWYKTEGGYTFEAEKSKYENCTCIDFKSLYPSIMIEYNICLSTYINLNDIEHEKEYMDINVINIENRKHGFRKDPVGILPGMLKKLLDERDKIKKQLKNVESKTYKIILDERQNALKICANSVYGVLGTKTAKYTRHSPASESVTFMGRNYVLWLRKFIIDNYELKVPYGDTDSCYLVPYINLSKDDMIYITHKILEDINNRLPKNIKVAYEEHYDTIFIMTKKKYILINNGKMKAKGMLTARRGTCIYVKNVYNKLLNMSLIDNVTEYELLQYLTEAYYNLLLNNVPIDELIMTKRISNNYVGDNLPQNIMTNRLKFEGKKVVPGTRIEYLYVDKIEDDDEEYQGDKMYTYEEVIENGMKIDNEYYIKTQMSKPINDLLTALGYKYMEGRAYSNAILKFKSY